MTASDARFGLTETRIGLWPYAVYPVVMAAVGARRARELAISARIVDAETALRLGLVEHIVGPDELESRAVELASTLAEGSAEAVANGLRYVQAIESLKTAEALQQAVRSRVAVEASADFAEGVQAFREKRAARWPSHR
jgi:methylglutaconyl-CoA hydratase